MKKLISKLGPFPAALTISMLSAVVSVLLSYPAMILAGSPNLILGTSMAALLPLALGTPMFYAYFRLYVRQEKARHQLEETNQRLAKALQEVRELKGLLPICSRCKKIRDDEGYWQGIESYLGEHSRAQLTHCLCPDCAKKMFPEIEDELA